MIKFYRKNYMWIWSIILFAVIAIIFINGIIPATESSLMSKRMASVVDQLIVTVTGVHERSLGEIELIIRKLAHFIQYFVLGTILYIVSGVWFPRKWYRYLAFLILGLPIPFIDEWFQISAAGRSGHFLDVLIDLSGLIGALIIGSIYSIVGTINQMTRDRVEDESGNK